VVAGTFVFVLAEAIVSQRLDGDAAVLLGSLRHDVVHLQLAANHPPAGTKLTCSVHLNSSGPTWLGRRTLAGSSAIPGLLSIARGNSPSSSGSRAPGKPAACWADHRDGNTSSSAVAALTTTSLRKAQFQTESPTPIRVTTRKSCLRVKRSRNRRVGSSSGMRIKDHRCRANQSVAARPDGEQGGEHDDQLGRKNRRPRKKIGPPRHFSHARNAVVTQIKLVLRDQAVRRAWQPNRVNRCLLVTCGSTRNRHPERPAPPASSPMSPVLAD